MFSWIAGLFSSKPDRVLDTVNGVGNWIDEQQFTEEEKANQKVLLLDWKLKWINATQGMNLARRWIALMFVVNFLITFQVCLWASVLSFVVDFPADKLIIGVVELAGAFQLGWIMITVVVFYFGKGMVDAGLAGQGKAFASKLNKYKGEN